MLVGARIEATVDTRELEQAFATTRNVLVNVKPDQMDDATPCQSWKVRDLVNHIVAGSQWFGSTMDSGDSGPMSGETPDFTDGDYVATFDDGVKKAMHAFGTPGALDKTVKLPFGEFPGRAFLGLATTDTLVHGWDLAKATGQPTDFDAGLSKQVFDNAKQTIPDTFRGVDGKAPFGPELDAPAGAPPVDQLAAYLGRTV
jgi:uncharacterized protein (TIGR03086 family)